MLRALVEGWHEAAAGTRAKRELSPFPFPFRGFDRCYDQPTFTGT
jgi:hypothetical protein